MKKISKELRKQIESRLTPEVGSAIIDGVDLIMRLRLGQLNQVCTILERRCSISQEGKGPDVGGPLYKALELGEFLECIKENPDCKHAESCWVTRKGFCPCNEKAKED